LLFLLAVNILQCLILLHKREQVVIDCSVLCALLEFTKKTFLIAADLVGTCYRLQQLMLAPFLISNAFYQVLICLLLCIAITFNLHWRTNVSGKKFALLYQVPKFTCNVVFNFLWAFLSACNVNCEINKYTISTFEYLIVRVRSPAHGINIHLLSVYRSPRKAAGRRFYNKFNILLETCCKYHAPMVICGDLNFGRTAQNPPAEFQTLLSHYGCVQSVNTATHITGNRLDVVITKAANIPSSIHGGNIPSHP
jgi:hypothetical protein